MSDTDFNETDTENIVQPRNILVIPRKRIRIRELLTEKVIKNAKSE